VKRRDVDWTGVIFLKLFCFEVKCSQVSYGEVLGDNSTMYIWCLSSAVVVLTCFVMCGYVYCVFCNMCVF